MPTRRLVFALACFTLAFAGSLQAQTPAPATPAPQAQPAVPATGVTVMVGDVTDSRTTGKFFKKFEVGIKLSGDVMEGALGVGRPVFTTATDDTGRSLLKDGSDADESLLWTLQPNKNKDTTLELNSPEMLNPARRASSVSLAGHIDVLAPKQDPSSTFNVKNLASMAGKPLQSLVPQDFQKSGLEITVLTKPLADKMKQEQEQAKAKAKEAAGKNPSPEAVGQALGQALGDAMTKMFSGFFSMGDNDLLFMIKDPAHQIAYLDVADESGNTIKTNGRMFSHDKETGITHYTASYAAPLAPTAQLVIYFATPKSLIRVPVKLDNLPLP